MHFITKAKCSANRIGIVGGNEKTADTQCASFVVNN